MSVMFKMRPGEDDVRCWERVECRQKDTWPVDENVIERGIIKTPNEASLLSVPRIYTKKFYCGKGMLSFIIC